jgi:glycosyltransferase involved in cell wall biosynthesis
MGVMKVLHLRSSSFVGSPEKLILGQIRCLSGEVSSEVAVLPDGSDAFYRAALDQGVQAHLLPGARFPLAAVWKLARLLRRGEHDILCTHDYKSNFVGWLAARFAPCRQAAVFHGRTSHNRKVRAYESLDNRVLIRLDAVVAVSEATRRKLSFLNGSVQVIRNALDPRTLESASSLDYRSAWGLGPEDVLLTTAGRLSPEKNHLLLLDAFRKVLEKNNRVHLAIAGEGPLRPALERAIVRLGLQGRARLLGSLQDLAPLYRATDIFILSSWTEGLPLVVLEAGFFGKPVVATDVGGVSEAAKDGVSALLVPPGSSEALAREIMILTVSKAFREKLGRHGKEIVEKEFSLPGHARKYQELYSRLCQRQTLWITWEAHRRTREISQALGIELVELNSRLPRILKHPFFLWKTTRALMSRRPRALLIQCPSLILAAWVLLWKKMFGYRLAVDAHNEAVSPMKHPRTTAILRLLHREADVTLVTNESLQRIVEAHGGRCFVLPDKIPCLTQGAETPAKEGPPLIVFICSFAEDEPYEEVIEAGRILGHDFSIHITGNPRKLKKKIRQNLPANIRLTGYLPEKAYLDLMRRADVLMDLTTREDCLVCGAYEAVALGKPLVLSDTKALRSYFHQGAVFTQNDRKSLSQSIEEAWRDRQKLKREMSLLKAELDADGAVRRERLLPLLLGRSFRTSPSSGHDKRAPLTHGTPAAPPASAAGRSLSAFPNSGVGAAENPDFLKSGEVHREEKKCEETDREMAVLGRGVVHSHGLRGVPGPSSCAAESPPPRDP